jgi:hypothetical protein
MDRTRRHRLDRLQIRAGPVIDLHELDRCPADLDEGDNHAAAGAIRLDDHVVTLEGGRKVVDLECHMWHRLDQVRVGRAFPVPLPLNTERIIQVIETVIFRCGSGISPSKELTVGIPT